MTSSRGDDLPPGLIALACLYAIVGSRCRCRLWVVALLLVPPAVCAVILRQDGGGPGRRWPGSIRERCGGLGGHADVCTRTDGVTPSLAEVVTGDPVADVRRLAILSLLDWRRDARNSAGAVRQALADPFLR